MPPISGKQRRRILQKTNHRCWYCGCPLVKGQPWGEYAAGRQSIDHLTPISRGGSDDDDNLVAACSLCNGRKGTRTLEEFRSHVTPACKAARLLDEADYLIRQVDIMGFFIENPFREGLNAAINYLARLPLISFYGERFPNEKEIQGKQGFYPQQSTGPEDMSGTSN